MLCWRNAIRPHVAMIVLGLVIFGANHTRADSAFNLFLESTWAEAQALGVSRATFDAAVRGLEPDLSLPDLAIPGRPEQEPQQPEFVQTPGQYLREETFDRRAARGRRPVARYI